MLLRVVRAQRTCDNKELFNTVDEQPSTTADPITDDNQRVTFLSKTISGPIKNGSALTKQ